MFLDQISLSMDEFEAIRLADSEGLYQEAAAEKMGISRQTFGRILEEAHRKIAECLVQGKTLKIEGGEYIMLKRKFRCASCEHMWEISYGSPRPDKCPQCKSANIHRAEKGRCSAGRAESGGAGGNAGRGGGFGRRGRNQK